MPDSSIDCSPCRLEWRPSRIGAGVAASVGVLAALSLLATRWGERLPAGLSWFLAALALPLALILARRALRRPRGVLVLLPQGRASWVLGGGAPHEGLATLHEQWPVATVRFASPGPTVVFWPDTLCDSGRRALRRWAGAAPEASPLTQFWTG